jgi:hypothetical protein
VVEALEEERSGATEDLSHWKCGVFSSRRTVTHRFEKEACIRDAAAERTHVIETWGKWNNTVARDLAKSWFESDQPTGG